MNQPDPADALDVLAKVGGFEIAGLVGVILAGAAARAARGARRLHRRRGGARRPSGSGRRRAARCSPRTARPSRATPASSRPSASSPYLDLGMRLGEGTGAALCIGLAAAAGAATEMATFKSAGVSERLPPSREGAGEAVRRRVAPALPEGVVRRPEALRSSA